MAAAVTEVPAATRSECWRLRAFVPERWRLGVAETLLGLSCLMLPQSCGAAEPTVPKTSIVQVRALAVRPGPSTVLYAGTTRGLFVSPDDGSTWTKASGDSVYSVTVLGRRPGIVYIGTETALLMSADEGRTWTKTGISGTTVTCLASERAKDVTYAGTSDGRVLVTRDQGRTWKQILTNGADRPILAMAVGGEPSPRLLVGTAKGGVFQTANQGESWQELKVGLDDKPVYSLVLFSRDHSLALAGTDDGLFRSGSDGTWERVMLDLGGRGVFYALCVAGPEGPAYAAAWGRGLFRSRDLGKTWGSAGTYPNVRTIAQDPSTPETLYIGSIGGILRTLDAGLTWIKITG